MSEKQVKEKETNSLKGVVCSDPGSRIVPVYKRVFDSELNRKVVKQTGEMDLFEFIQASKSSTDLAALEKRFLATGEIPQVDPKMVANGVDFTKMPKDIHEVYSMISDIDNSYSKLPDSIQKVFGSKEAYMEAALKGSLKSTIVKHFNSQKVPADTTPKEGE